MVGVKAIRGDISGTQQQGKALSVTAATQDKDECGKNTKKARYIGIEEQQSLGWECLRENRKTGVRCTQSRESD